MNKKTFSRHLCVIILISLILRIGLLIKIGPQVSPDTAGYLQVARTLSQTGRFACIDEVTGELTPSAYRMPFYHTMVALLMKVFGEDIAWPLALLNIGYSTIVVLFTVWIFTLLAGHTVGCLSGYLMALNLNSIFNSVLLLTDTMFAAFAILSVIIGLIAIDKKGSIWFFLWGLSIGLATMVRPTWQYFWVIPLIILIAQKTRWKEKLKSGIFILIGVSIMIIPWMVRNYRQLDFRGLYLYSGVTMLWRIVDLVQPSTYLQIQENKKLSDIRDIVSMHNNSQIAFNDVRKKLRISPVDANKYFLKLGVELIFKHPLILIGRFSRNLVNIITSPSSVLEIIRRSLGKEKGYFQPLKEALRERMFRTLIVNIVTRVLLLLIFIAFLTGTIILWQNSYNHSQISFLFITVVYTLLLSAVPGAYDRFRLPVEPLILGFASFFIVFIWKNKI